MRSPRRSRNNILIKIIILYKRGSSLRRSLDYLTQITYYTNMVVACVAAEIKS